MISAHAIIKCKMSFSLYVHIPFCKKKCPYCSFSSITGSDNHFVDEYFEALSAESEMRSTGIYSYSPQTIYIGGGTPSIISPKHIKQIIENIYSNTTAEFTVEANPESVSRSWLDGMLELGANRLSIGIQSLDDRILHNLGRIHSKSEALRSFEITREAGFKNISVDLMFGVPGQTLEIWNSTVEEVIELQPEHISCYSLGIEEDTEYYTMSGAGKLRIPEDDETAEMYLCMADTLENAGYGMYEISNFAKDGMECMHNRAYWDFTPYLGLGASAHSFDGTIRSWNESNPETYAGKAIRGESAVSGNEISDGNTRIIEMIMLSLRTCEGLNYKNIETLLSDRESRLKSKIDLFVKSGHMEAKSSGNITFTHKGAVIANEILSDILADLL
ncbi:radical SAM family heme chaperone HemW [Candidatus Latescibacterota bacterium]